MSKSILVVAPQVFMTEVAVGFLHMIVGELGVSVFSTSIDYFAPYSARDHAVIIFMPTTAREFDLAIARIRVLKTHPEYPAERILLISSKMAQIKSDSTEVFGDKVFIGLGVVPNTKRQLDRFLKSIFSQP